MKGMVKNRDPTIVFENRGSEIKKGSLSKWLWTKVNLKESV